MKLVSYNNGGAGVVIDDYVVALADLDGVPTDITALLAAGPDVAEQVSRQVARVRQRTPLSAVALGAPIPAPSTAAHRHDARGLRGVSAAFHCGRETPRPLWLSGVRSRRSRSHGGVLLRITVKLPRY